MAAIETMDLVKWTSKLTEDMFLNLYNTYLSGPRTPLFLESDMDPATSVSDLSRKASQFLARFRVSTDAELLELYFVQAFLIVGRLLWIIGSNKLEQVRNLTADLTFQQVFGTPPFTEENLIFFINEFETHVQSMENGNIFDAELERAKALYFEENHVERNAYLADYIQFMELFIPLYEADVRKVLSDPLATPLYPFYLMLLILCKLHMYTNVIEPKAVIDRDVFDNSLGE